MRLYSVKESKKTNDGKKTTITITTEDEKVIRGILSAPHEETKKTTTKAAPKASTKTASKSKSSIKSLGNEKLVKKAKTGPAAKKQASKTMLMITGPAAKKQATKTKLKKANFFVNLRVDGKQYLKSVDGYKINNDLGIYKDNDPRNSKKYWYVIDLKSGVFVCKDKTKEKAIELFNQKYSKLYHDLKNDVKYKHILEGVKKDFGKLAN